MSELIAVGCGPGDPDLLTVKAVKAIKEANVIACPTSKEDRPSIALSIVSSLINKNTQKIIPLIFPMTKNKDILSNTWKKNSEILSNIVLSNKKVIYLTVGDPYLYSTWIYLHKEIRAKYPNIKITVIPGIVSIFTFASKIGISLAEGSEKLSVIPSCYDLTQVKEIAKNSDTLVFLKDGRYFDQVIQLLKDADFSDNSLFAIGQDLGTEYEIVKKMKLGQVNDSTIATKYFSILVVKRE